jgi:hypothetical protein
MTDDELMAEVQALRLGGTRGEVEELEGTPDGTYLYHFSRQLPVFNSAEISVGFALAGENIQFAWANSTPTPRAAILVSSAGMGTA